MLRNSTILIITTFIFLVTSGFEKEKEATWIIEVDGNPYQVRKEIEQNLPRMEVLTVYDTVLNGLAVKGPPDKVEQLSEIDAIVNRHPVQTYHATKIENINQSVPFLKEVQRGNAPIPYTGKGVKVGVIDTGIDYTHPDLIKNYKGGFDVVDFDEDPMETTENGATSHGTHVAGIIAADGKMKGIAPDASLYGYRALGPGGAGTSVQVIAAIEEAVKDGMDVINLSLGNEVNGPDWPTSVAVDTAVKLGVTVVVAAGNTGPDTWTVGSPATSTEAITVGASTPPMKVPIIKDSFHDKEIPLIPMIGSSEWELEKRYRLVDGGIGDKPLNNARGKIVLMKRGKVPFTDKAMLAEAAGAEAVIIYNNEKGEFRGAIDGSSVSIPVVAVSKEDGKWLSEKSKSANQWLTTEYRKEVDHLAAFSSRGPVTSNWTIKPDILAPGVAIDSTVPGGYQELQGTSMAAPHIAGIAALLKEAHPDWEPEDIKTAILSTAEPLVDEAGELYMPTEQGMGKVDIKSALKPAVKIRPSKLNFGRFNTNFPKKTLPISIKNTSDTKQTLSFEQPKHKQGMQWILPESFTLAPGEKKTVKIRLHVQPVFLEKGLHQGWIKMKSIDQTFELPYLFMLETSDYPRAMGFEITASQFDQTDYQYRFYLPEDSEYVKIDLYNPDTLTHVKKLVELEEVKEGVVEGEVNEKLINNGGRFIAVITIQNDKNHYSYGTPVEIYVD
ncbi:S8 family serine peptidase [Thalassobacillus pellis]|uniref:S8 family serine peptidase n=1 Tax=Thalassobacillus pellis TaxID=748008 RepID=UPI0019603E69|nr:S8 family serine peptidase [Thalassobacillus pellis]MBM7551768.1 minor extracellular serine protease Vpr [Thalassobacillus pellis]